MQYGYFDDKVKEYVITRPDTPQSWSNYLGSTEYGAIITNNVGGYSFYKSGARGRILRLRFNSVPMDQPGRYFYLRDNENGDYWSSSWQPVGKSLDDYQSICRHGTAYTLIESHYSGIATETTYFVPLGQTFEYWRLKVTNESDRPRKLSLFSFCEFTNQWDTYQDLVNLQYSLFIVRGELTGDNLLRIAIQDNLTPETEGFFIHDIARHSWMGLAGSTIDGYDTSREAFIGPYHGYHNPLVVEKGQCTNSNVYGDNACGSLQTNLSLQPGESREVLVLLGIGDARSIGKKTMAEYGSLERATVELQKLKDHWHDKLGSLVVETPDEEFNHTINVWGQYNSLISFAWSRSASLVYNGERDGLGFRELGAGCPRRGSCHSRRSPPAAGIDADRAGLQRRCDAYRPTIRAPTRKGKTASCEEYRSDDCLWFFNAVPAYVNETGDVEFYTRILPYADEGSATVFGHLRRALEFNLERTGKNGLPCGLAADWNDCLKLGYYGESLFVAFQVRYGLTIYSEIAEQLGFADESYWALEERKKMDASIQVCAWDGGWFIWAIGDDGTVYGTKDSKEGQVYFNTQIWSVISGAATPEQSKLCMETVKERLATPYGLMLSAPPFVKMPIDVMRAVVFNPGIKENAGIFNHTNGWGVMAECLLGNGDRAYEYYRSSMPAAYNTRAEIRQSEPYVHGQTTYSTFSPRPGNTRTSWLTGAAAWSYFSATQYILGLRPESEGLRIDPCIPKAWNGFTVKRKFRDRIIFIQIKNPSHVNKGVNRMILNGKSIEGNLIPFTLLEAENYIEIILGD